jgi:hypothetical protein
MWTLTFCDLSYMAVMLNMVDAADGFPVYPPCPHSIFIRAINLLQSQYPQIFPGALVALYLSSDNTAEHTLATMAGTGGN